MDMSDHLNKYTYLYEEHIWHDGLYFFSLKPLSFNTSALTITFFYLFKDPGKGHSMELTD